MRVSKAISTSSSSIIQNPLLRASQLQQKDINSILDKVFDKYDQDHNQILSKFQFPLLIKHMVEAMGGQIPGYQDIQDLFNLLDINGDQVISRQQLFTLFSRMIMIVQDRGQNIFKKLNQSFNSR